MGNGNSRKSVEVLNSFRSPVSQEQSKCSGNGSSNQTVPELAGGGYDQGADEGEVPEVPDVYVESLGHIREQKNNVDKQCDRNDP